MAKSEPPYDPPREEVLLAFANAMDAWSGVENQFMTLLNLLLQSPDINRVAAMFNSVIGFRNQLNMIKAVADVALKEKTSKALLDKLIGHAKTRNTKRNNIVHGHWNKIEITKDNIDSHIILFRHFYGSTPFGHILLSKKEINKHRGKSVFFLDDLKHAENEFRLLVRETLKVQIVIMREFGPQLRS